MGIGWKASNSGKPREHQGFTPRAHGEVAPEGLLGVPDGRSLPVRMEKSAFSSASRRKGTFAPSAHGEVTSLGTKTEGLFRSLPVRCAHGGVSGYLFPHPHLLVRSLCAWRSRVNRRWTKKPFSVHSLCAWRSRRSEGEQRKKLSFTPCAHGEVELLPGALRGLRVHSLCAWRSRMPRSFSPPLSIVRSVRAWRSR